MDYKKIKSLKRQVEYILMTIPETRNDDITLMIELWKKFYPNHIKRGYQGTIGIWLSSLYDLPREDGIKRVRADWQNTKHKYLPTRLAVAIARGVTEDEWRVSMGYPTKGSTGTLNPSWTPESEKVISPQKELFTPPETYPDKFISKEEQAIN